MAERLPCKQRAAGSMPAGGSDADVAQLVARHLAEVEVTGSIPVVRSHGVLAQRQRHQIQILASAGSNPADATESEPIGDRASLLTRARAGRCVGFDCSALRLMDG
jgi:hypothetical protein